MLYSADHMAPSGSMEEILILSRREEPEIYREIDKNYPVLRLKSFPIEN